ncbi:MAG TPA: TlpA disulfide reductase family protein, partial [Ilumatobacteraceae bacterium]|nr:TlpA disulfide reductase family protein [Ilumatobacteraceae bacterium]
VFDARPRRRRLAPFISLAVAAALAALFIVLANSKSDHPDVASSYLLGKPAPAVVSATLDGKPFDLSRRKGSWVVLNFFQSSCLPCKAEHPELVAFAAQQAGISDGAELYTVVKDDSNANVSKWFAEQGGSWPIITDDDGSIATAFGVAKVPETWIIDPSGIVARRIITTVTADFLATELQQLRQAYA